MASDAATDVKAELRRRYAASAVRAPFELSEQLLDAFVRAKKTPDKALAALVKYAEVATKIDFATLTWTRLERELRRGFVCVPSAPFAESLDGTSILFFHSEHYDPHLSGQRLILATLWLIIHFLLFKSPKGLSSGITVVGNQGGFKVANFFPEILKSLLDSITNCLPVRIREVALIDTPFFSLMLYKVVKPWLSEKTQQRVNFTDRKALKEKMKASELLPSFGGTRAVELDAWISALKDFYDAEWLPLMTAHKVVPPPIEYKYWEVEA